ncbi:unnamed protein product [Boreogadus saida]
MLRQPKHQSSEAEQRCRSETEGGHTHAPRENKHTWLSGRTLSSDWRKQHNHCLVPGQIAGEANGIDQSIMTAPPENIKKGVGAWSPFKLSVGLIKPTPIVPSGALVSSEEQRSFSTRGSCE